MPAHATLTGADLHEPKGADTASIATVYVADGSGSGDWQKVASENIDTTSIKNTNKEIISVLVPDLLTAKTIVVPIPFDCTLVNATSCITGAFTGANTVITLLRGGISSVGTITIAETGSAEGVLDTITTPSNNVFVAPTYLKITSDGNPSGGAADATILLEFEYD
jgi:hypothetical protein